MGTEAIINPFRLDIDPMERLLLVNFEKDPDAVYVSFEPQVFNDTINGQGYMVIGWRRDGRVDIFHQPGLKLNPANYDITGKGLANMVERELPGAMYQVNDAGVQAHYEFQDSHDRTVIININEQNPRQRKPFGLLAPLGATAESPSALPVVLLHDFYFVRRQHTAIEISIDGKRHQPDVFPIPIDGARMYLTRYSPKPVIARLNPAFDGELASLQAAAGTAEVLAGDCVLVLDWTGGTPAIKRVIRLNGTSPIELSFDEAFPDIKTLGNHAGHAGSFEIAGHPSTGRIRGRYTVDKMDGQIKITMIPTQGWQPRLTKVSLFFFYTMVGVFKKWPTTYKWTALIQEPQPPRSQAYSMRSQWERIK